MKVKTKCDFCTEPCGNSWCVVEISEDDKCNLQNKEKNNQE